MRKANQIFIFLLLIIGLSACSNDTKSPNSSESDISSYAPVESSIREESIKEDVISDTDDSENQTDENDIEDEFPYVPKYEVTYETLSGYSYATSPDGRYVIYGLKDGHEGSPVYLYDEYTHEIKMIKVICGASYPYTFGHDNLIIVRAVRGLVFCDPQTCEPIDNIIDFDYKDGARLTLGICYDAEQEKYIVAWRNTNEEQYFEQITLDDLPAEKIKRGYVPFYLSIFDKEGIYLWDVDPNLFVIDEMQAFIITVDMEAKGDGMVLISDPYLKNSNNESTPEVETSYMKE